jgi:hypothetical protein
MFLVPFFVRHSTFQDRRQLPNGLLFFRREILLTRLRVDHQQIERAGPLSQIIAANGGFEFRYQK